MDRAEYLTYLVTLKYPPGYHPVITREGPTPGADIETPMTSILDEIVIRIVADEQQHEETA